MRIVISALTCGFIVFCIQTLVQYPWLTWSPLNQALERGAFGVIYSCLFKYTQQHTVCGSAPHETGPDNTNQSASAPHKTGPDNTNQSDSAPHKTGPDNTNQSDCRLALTIFLGGRLPTGFNYIFGGRLPTGLSCMTCFTPVPR